jgi:hypothetical protein
MESACFFMAARLFERNITDFSVNIKGFEGGIEDFDRSGTGAEWTFEFEIRGQAPKEIPPSPFPGGKREWGEVPQRACASS